MSVKHVRVVVLLELHRDRYVEQISNHNVTPVIRTSMCYFENNTCINQLMLNT